MHIVSGIIGKMGGNAGEDRGYFFEEDNRAIGIAFVENGKSLEKRRRTELADRITENKMTTFR